MKYSPKITRGKQSIVPTSSLFGKAADVESLLIGGANYCPPTQLHYDATIPFCNLGAHHMLCLSFKSQMLYHLPRAVVLYIDITNTINHQSQCLVTGFRCVQINPWCAKDNI